MAEALSAQSKSPSKSKLIGKIDIEFMNTIQKYRWLKRDKNVKKVQPGDLKEILARSYRNF